MNTPSLPRCVAIASQICKRYLLLAAVLGSMGGAPAVAQSYNVSTAEELAAAVNQAFANSQAISATLTTINLTADITGTAQMFVNANVVINGGGYTLDMNSADRAFFIAGGNVMISNLTIANGLARGGSGATGGGGGAGLGGAIFVGSGTYLAWDGSVAGTGISAPNVTLSGVSFQGNSAVGGTIIPSTNKTVSGGGGGMGGNGGLGDSVPQNTGGGGGGGFGVGADGGNAGPGTSEGMPGAAGAFNLIAGTNLSGGPGGTGDLAAGGAGGNQGGGGGGGGPGSTAPGTGGGGGLGGERGYYADGTTPNNGGLGGFGGGGGGNSYFVGGSGGFGGGGGGTFSLGFSSDYSAGNGGFGGGGGAGQARSGSGGFGGGDGESGGSGIANPQGGGGLGAGGAVFVMDGGSLFVNDAVFSGNTVTGGSSANSGSAIGANLFLGGDVTFDIASNMTISDLGGAGNMTDPNVSAHASDPNAQGGLIKLGAGTLTLSGVNYYSGQTVIRSGVVALGAGAQEIGTSGTVVGVDSGEVATLQLTGGSTWQHGVAMGPLVIGQNANSQGNVIIGSGETSLGAVVGVQTFQGGAGAATVTFQQMYGASGEAHYEFNTTMTGNLAVVQDGPGTTVLNPLYGSNTYTARTEVMQGTLIAKGVNALGTNEVLVSGSSTLVLASDASVTGLVGMQVGMYLGDNATLQLEDGNTLSLVPGGKVVIAGSDPSSGKVIIGSGGTSRGAELSMEALEGGAGNAVVEFQQMYSPVGWVLYEFTTALTGSIQVVQNGPGKTLLAPSASNTYWGGTVVQQGVLQVGGTAEIPGNNALGSGGVTVTGGQFFNASGGALINEVTLSGGQYTVSVNSGASYAGMADATSGFGNGRATTASVLAGISSAWNTLNTNFVTTSSALNDSLRISDVYSFSGTNTDIFVLELSMTNVEDGAYLGWLDASGKWENAVLGNMGNNANPDQLGFGGSFSAFQSIYGTTLSSYLGAYGMDSSTGSVWVVLNHNSEFAIVVPEPSTWALAVGGGLLVLACTRRRRNNAPAPACLKN